MKFQTSIIINRPQEAVFECVSSVAFIEAFVAPIRAAKYGISFEDRPYVVRDRPRVTELYQVTEGPIIAGTTFKQGSGNAGNFLESTIEVIEHEYPNVLAFHITTHLIEGQIRYIFEQATDETRLRMRTDVQFRGCFMNLIALLSIALTILLNKNALQTYRLEVKQYIEEHC